MKRHPAILRRVRATRCAAAHENSDYMTGRTSSITTNSDAVNDFPLTHPTRA